MHELEEAMETYTTDEDQTELMDLQNTLTDISQEIAKLPQTYSDLINLFKTLKNKNNIDEYINYLSDIALREEFYAKFNLFAKILKMALSTVTFYDYTPTERIDLYKNDLKKFAGIRVAVNNIYVDNVSFAQYEKQLQKLLDQHVITEEIIRLTEQIDILDTETFNEELEKVVGNRAKAEKIALSAWGVV